MQKLDNSLRNLVARTTLSEVQILNAAQAFLHCGVRLWLKGKFIDHINRNWKVAR